MALTIGGGHHSPREVVGIPLCGTVRLHHTGDAAPFIQQVLCLAAVPVHDAGDAAPGVVLQLLAGPAHAHDPPLGPGQVVFVLHTAAHAVQPLEQPAIGVVGIALEHVAVRAEHREHPALGVIDELGAVATVRLSTILVGADQPHNLVSIIGIAGL